MNYFCTYFDIKYVPNGLALYRSLVRHAAPFRLWVLCFDDLTYKTLQSLKLDEVVPISLKDFEAGDEELLQAKANRSRIEYYFTCTPSLPLYILKNCPEVDLITYVDADLFFFSDLSPIYEELGNNSILIIGHRFPPHKKSAEVNGVYNVGFLSFRNDDVGIKCLRWWRNRCLEWCYDRIEEGRCADQKYLDDWPIRFPRVVVLKYKGAGVAPWNVENYSFHIKNGRIVVDSLPLIFFHFHKLRQIGRWLYDPQLPEIVLNKTPVLRWNIYGVYLLELYRVSNWILTLTPVVQHNIRSCSIRGVISNEDVESNIFISILRTINRQLHLIKVILKGHIWVVIRGRIIRVDIFPMQFWKLMGIVKQCLRQTRTRKAIRQRTHNDEG